MTTNANVATFASRTLDTAAAAKMIRSEIKRQLGLTSRDVSVRTDRYSMGSAVRVRISRLEIPIAAIEQIADQFERVRRCEQSGDVLNGGNMYVQVDYSHDAKAAAERKVAAALKAFGSAKVKGTPVVIEQTGPNVWWVRDGKRSEPRCYSAEHAASMAVFYMTKPVTW